MKIRYFLPVALLLISAGACDDDDDDEKGVDVDVDKEDGTAEVDVDKAAFGSDGGTTCDAPCEGAIGACAEDCR